MTRVSAQFNPHELAFTNFTVLVPLWTWELIQKMRNKCSKISMEIAGLPTCKKSERFRFWWNCTNKVCTLEYYTESKCHVSVYRMQAIICEEKEQIRVLSIMTTLRISHRVFLSHKNITVSLYPQHSPTLAAAISGSFSKY